MHLVVHETIADFRHQAESFLTAMEVENNLILGISQRLLDHPDAYDEVLFAHVADDNGQVIACLMRTPPHGPAISTVTDMAAIPLMVEACAERYETLPSIYGEPQIALAFAELWSKHSGQPHAIKMEQGLYKLTEVKPPQTVGGEAHRATLDDLEAVLHFFVGFEEGTGLGPTPREQAEKNIRRRLASDALESIWLWCHEGQAVSMAGITRNLPNGSGVGLVYTPPDFRKRGYASAVTAAVSQTILDSGKQYAFLYTDLANPTSNKIYQEIGYRHVTDHHLIAFEDA